ncbi:MAG: transposase [bacterium]|nr:transposase [bacterium]
MKSSDKQRKSIQLKGYDYSQSRAYFVTVCIHNKECLLGNIADGQMQLNEYGHIVVECWNTISDHFNNVQLDGSVMMPNHIHGILMIVDNCRDTPCHVSTGEQFGKPTRGSLPTIIRSFKSVVTKRINEMRNISCIPIWQSRYYEHIIRNEKSLNKIREYIIYIE